jgi:hypothetical protein
MWGVLAGLGGPLQVNEATSVVNPSMYQTAVLFVCWSRTCSARVRSRGRAGTTGVEAVERVTRILDGGDPNEKCPALRIASTACWVCDNSYTPRMVARSESRDRLRDNSLAKLATDNIVYDLLVNY